MAFFDSYIFTTQGVGKILFEPRELRHKKTEEVVSPFGGIAANPHRPSCSCSLFDSLGMGAAVHPAPTYIEPYSGELLAKMVCGGMSVAMIVGMRDGGRFGFFLVWFVATAMNFFGAKALPQGNGVLAHQMGTTACGVVAGMALCKLFVDTVFAGGFGESTESNEPNKAKGKGTAHVEGADASTNVLTTARSLNALEGSGNVIGGVTPQEAAEALRAEIAAKGGRRIITEADVKRRMELMNADRLRESYANAVIDARTKLNAQIEANAEPTAQMLEAAEAPAQLPVSAASAGALPSSTGAEATTIGSIGAGARKGYSVAASKASQKVRPAENFGAMAALRWTAVSAHRLTNASRIFLRHVRRSPTTKAGAIMMGLSYYNFRRLDWWATYVPELRALKGREDSSAGIDVYKGTYDAQSIDPDMIPFAALMPRNREV